MLHLLGGSGIAVAQQAAWALGKATSCPGQCTCKHMAACDLETGRYGNDYDPTQQDMADYFLAPFKTCVRDVGVGSVMCSYNAVDGKLKTLLWTGFRLRLFTF